MVPSIQATFTRRKLRWRGLPPVTDERLSEALTKRTVTSRTGSIPRAVSAILWASRTHLKSRISARQMWNGAMTDRQNQRIITP